MDTEEAQEDFSDDQMDDDNETKLLVADKCFQQFEEGFRRKIKEYKAEQEKLPQIDLNKPCSSYRWYRVHLKRGRVPMKGGDSLSIEFKYRINLNLFISSEDIKLRDTQFAHLKSEEAKVCVLNDYYVVNEDFTKIEEIYGGEHSIEIGREIWFEFKSPNTITPLPPGAVKKIELHLEKFFPETMDCKPKDLDLTKTFGMTIKWISVETAEIHREGTAPTELLHGYPETAEYDDGRYKTKHVVFVVHGVGHDGAQKKNCIYHEAKHKGMASEFREVNPEEKSQVMVIGIHWRNFFLREKGHTCVGTVAEWFRGVLPEKSTDLAADLGLYHCQKCGPQIRKIVSSQLQTQFLKFLSHHSDFDGPVSLMGHSLGSVICYDILTNEENHRLGFEVQRLVTFGSPLQIFLEKQGKSAIIAFRENAKNLKIINTFHPLDGVAQRLEPLIHPDYKRLPPVIIRISQKYLDEEKKRNPKMKVTFLYCLMKGMSFCETVLSYGRKVPPLSKQFLEKFNTTPRIDYELEEHYKLCPIRSHSIYWTHCCFHLHLVDILLDRVLGIDIGKQTFAGESLEPNPNNRGAEMPEQEDTINPEALSVPVLAPDLRVLVVNNEDTVPDIGKLVINAAEDREAVPPVQA